MFQFWWPKATNEVGIPTAKQAEVQGLQILLQRWQSNPRFLGSQKKAGKGSVNLGILNRKKGYALET